MDDEKLKKQIGMNIVSYRKQMGLTQVGLAEKLNYSDKAVSKWERGESVPDVITLVQLAELFGVTVNDMIKDLNELPAELGKVERVMEKAVEKTFKRKADKRIILQLSSILVWFVALLFFVLFTILDIPKSWIAFIYAVPADAIVRLSLLSAWKDYRRNKLLISVIMWGSITALYASMLTFLQLALWSKIWVLFLLGIPGQIAILLWFRIYRRPKKEENDG